MESDVESVSEERWIKLSPASSLSPSPTPSPPQSPPLPANVLRPEKDFIVKFEGLPELWDSNHPHYTNKYKRNEKLVELWQIMKKIRPYATLEDVKKKINTLRSNYRRELKKIEISKYSATGTDQLYSPKVWYFPYLHFLSKMEQPGPPPKEQMDPDPHDQEEEQLEEKYSQRIRDNAARKRSFASISTVPVSSVQSSAEKRKQIPEQLSDSGCRCQHDACNRAPQVQVTSPMALEWTDILDRLDPLQRLYAKKAINDVLFEAELGCLNRNSVKINEPSSHCPSTPTSNVFTSPLSPQTHPSPSPSTQLTDPLP